LYAGWRIVWQSDTLTMLLPPPPPLLLLLLL
jgi:hypothetical protein